MVVVCGGGSLAPVCPSTGVARAVCMCNQVNTCPGLVRQISSLADLSTGDNVAGILNNMYVAHTPALAPGAGDWDDPGRRR